MARRRRLCGGLRRGASQRDGKDAAVVAELAALGKAMPWEYQPADPWEQELAYWVEWMVAHRQMLTIWQGRLEGLLACDWPEATQVRKLSSGDGLRVLKGYGTPRAVAAEGEAAKLLARWGGAFLAPEKIEQLLAGAGAIVGVRLGEWPQRQIRSYAQQALAARQEADGGRNGSIAASPRDMRYSKPKGRWWACQRHVSCGERGDPRKCRAAGAFREAMGLNLVERSSGTYEGRLRSASAVTRGRGNGSILRSCGWCRSAACVLGTKPRKPMMKPMPGGSWIRDVQACRRARFRRCP